MRQEVIDSAGVHVTGTFALAAGLDTVNWLADALELLDPDGDTVYSGSVVVPTGVYEFKYVNGNSWGQDEQLVGGCLSGNNRVIMVNADRNLDTVCFGSCHACQPPPPIRTVTFKWICASRPSAQMECMWPVTSRPQLVLPATGTHHQLPCPMPMATASIPSACRCLPAVTNTNSSMATPGAKTKSFLASVVP